MSITPTLAEHPSINLPSWLHAVNRYARTLFSEFDPYGLLFLVADDVVWQALPANHLPADAQGNPVFRARPTFDTPPPLLLPTLTQQHAMLSSSPQKPVWHICKLGLSSPLPSLRALVRTIVLLSPTPFTRLHYLHQHK
jgi:hypothetical protein